MKRVLLFAFLVVLSLGAEAQQLTRFAVVDLSRVYVAFFRESRAVREFEERSAMVQSEIDDMTRKIDALRASQANAELQGDRSESLRLQNEIYRQSEYLKDYYRLKTAELDDQRSKLTQSGVFLDQVYDEIRFIAQSEGYSMVLNKQENTGILWFSPTVDITNKVIQNLTAKSRR
ncbi:OmpH/Skp family outer membrane protein [Breznakiellaceae bacterium SP9]